MLKTAVFAKNQGSGWISDTKEEIDCFVGQTERPTVGNMKRLPNKTFQI